MFLLEKGDKVKLSNSSKDFLGKELFNALSDEIFVVVDIKTDKTCENNDINCTCDKYITIKNGPIVIESLVSDELIIDTIKQAI